MKFSLFPNCVLLSLIILGGCKKNYITEEDSLIPSKRKVVVESIKKTNEPLPVFASGVLASKAESQLSFKTGGVIADIKVDEGDYFKKGQLLASLDLDEIRSQVVQARNSFVKAERDLNRIKSLFQENAATLEQVQDLTTTYEVAEANLKIAEFNLRYSQIIAPTDGKVLRRFAEEGEVVSAGRPILFVGSTGKNHFIIKVGITDKDIVKLRINDTAQIHFDPYPGVSFAASVSEINESADPHTGTFEVELTLKPTNFILKNGFVGKLEIFPSQQPDYYKIPMNALVDGDNNSASILVFDSTLKQAKKVHVRPLSLGKDYFTVSRSELNEGTLVITEGAAYIDESKTIEPIQSI